MLDLNGFRMLESVANFGPTRMFRIIRESDQAHVLLKTTSDDNPGASLIRDMQQEYELLKQLKGIGAAQPNEFRVVKGRPIMLLDDAPGKTLEQLIANRRQRPNLLELLTVAASAAYALHELHQLKRCHGMITPRHFIVHPGTGEVRWLDLGNGGCLKASSKEKLPKVFLSYQMDNHMNELRGKFGFQSDLYALGVTLHHWFEGILPMPSDLLLEHDVMQEKQKAIKLPYTLEWLPEMISIITGTCTQRKPALGYASAEGIYMDLMQCLHQLEQSGEIHPFQPALDDKPVQPELSGYMYGRDAEQMQLQEAYQRAANGSLEVVWISGSGGIGKTTFVEQTMQRLLPDSPFFVTVKFDSGFNTAPNEVWSHILTQLTDHLLQASSVEAEIWKLRILEAIEGHGELLVKLAPRLSLLIGEQPPVATLASSMAHHRLYTVMNRFLQLFGQFELPLVLVFDDLQWADEASLHYLHHMITYAGSFKHVLVILAYRDTVWTPRHPMSQIEAELNEQSRQITSIRMNELSASDLLNMLDDSLDLAEDQLKPFADVLLHKTAGHPLFLRRLFQQLLDDGLLTFDAASKRWQCDLESVKGLKLAEGVADYLSDRLARRLPEQAKFVLSRAAHLGRVFTLERLAAVLEWMPEQLQESIQAAVKEGIIRRHSASESADAYEFLHDRIRQTAAELVGESEQLVLLADIGRMLMQRMPEEGDRYLFEAVNHLNEAAAAIDEPHRKLELMKLNIQAGQKAKQATAYESSLDYFIRAASFIQEQDWHEHYAFTFQIYQELAETAHYCSRFELANETYELLLARARSDWDRAIVYRMLIQHEASQDHHEEVLRLARLALQLLGMKAQFKPHMLELGGRWIRCRRKLRNYSPAAIVDLLEPMKDERLLMIMSILGQASNACFYTNKAGWVAVTLTMMELTLNYGVAPESSLGFVGYAMILSLQFRWHLEATEWGGAALAVSKSYPHLFVKTLTAYSLCYDSWRQYDANFIHTFAEHAGKVGLESGDLWQGNQSVMLHNVLMLQFGEPLPDIYERLQARSHDFARHNVRDFWLQASLMSEFTIRLTGHRAPDDIYYRFEEDFMEWGEREEVDARKETSADGAIWTLGVILGYLFGDYERAEYCLERVKQHIKYHEDAFIESSGIYFYEALTLSAKHDSADKLRRQQYGRRIQHLMKKLQRYARRCPINYMDKYMLVKAEWLRVTGQKRKAGEMYVQSIETSRNYKHYHNWGIAAECYARFALKEKQYSRASQYIREAYEAYGNWGAAVKQAELVSLYGELLDVRHATGGEQLDEQFMLKALHALSVEMNMPRLLQTFLRIMLQSTGAEFGALLMDSDSGWSVQAYGTEEELHVDELPLEDVEHLLPVSIVGYVIRTRETVVLAHAAESGIFSRLELVREKQMKSVLCLPIIHQQKLISVLYLDNKQISGIFTRQKLDVLKLLSAKCAISLENARLYSGIQALKDSLKQQVKERTVSLEQSMRETSAALAEMSVFAERNRIAQDIHDVVGHGLTSTILQIEAGKRLLQKEDREGALSRLQVAQDLIRHSLDEIRGSVHMLKSGSDFDIVTGLYELLAQTGLHVEVDIGDIPDIPFIYKKVIYHALQEGLTNGIRHGGSKGFAFSFTYDGSLLLFRLRDYGSGTSEIRMGFGLTAMKERVEQHGGRLSVNAEPGEGCVLQIVLPYRTEYGRRTGQ